MWVRVSNYFSNIGVAEFLVEAAEVRVGDKLLITGPTTGAVFLTLDEARVDLKPVDVVRKGQHLSIKVAIRYVPVTSFISWSAYRGTEEVQRT